jgi:hypothetical protein
VKLVAEGQSSVILDDGGPYFIVYMPDEDRIVEYVRKEEQPNYVMAAISKWGFQPMDEEVEWGSFEPTLYRDTSEDRADHLNEIRLRIKELVEVKRAQSEEG